MDLFAAGAAVLGVVLVHGLAGLPAFGDYHGVYGTVLNRVTVAERHATDVITAINFDYRGLDTMGEEFILFAASIGLVVLLREQRDEHVDSERAGEAGDPEQSGDAASDAEQRSEPERAGDEPDPGRATATATVTGCTPARRCWQPDGGWSARCWCSASTSSPTAS